MNTDELSRLKVLIELAISEDFSDRGDLTSLSTIPEEMLGKAAFVARVDGVLAGLQVAEFVANRIDPKLEFIAMAKDGDRITKGQTLGVYEGPMRSLLGAERTALNFMQRLSGIATQTREFVDLVAETKAKILDTRKTTPGWRLIEKYAVRMGGGTNHRVGLYDGILIKDNHLAALTHSQTEGPDLAWAKLANRMHELRHYKVPIEIEIDSISQLDEAFACRPDIILLDNMSLEDLRSCVNRRDNLMPMIQLEASGGVNLQTVRDIAMTGVDRISVGAITHSVKALDIALDYVD